MHTHTHIQHLATCRQRQTTDSHKGLNLGVIINKDTLDKYNNMFLNKVGKLTIRTKLHNNQNMFVKYLAYNMRKLCILSIRPF